MAKKENKEKRISVNKFEATSVKREDIVVPYGDDLEIVVHPFLPLESMLEFVEEVVSTVVDRDDGVYMPEVEEFAIRRAVIRYYSNISLPSNISKMYYLLFNSGVYNVIKANIDENQFDEIIASVKFKVQHEKSVIESEAARKTMDLLQQVENVTKQFDELFGGIDRESMAVLFDRVAEMTSFDEKEIANAVLDRIAESQNESSQAGATEIKLVDAK